MKFLKILAGLLGLIVVLMVAAIIIVPQVVDPNDFRDDIVAKVKETTGRDLQINGEIELSLFPWLGLELGELKLSNAKGFDATPFASIQQAAVKVRIMPLLSKQVEVDRILLDGLHLNLAKSKDGRTNWDDLAGAQKAQTGDGTTEPEPRSERVDETAALPLAGLAIGGVSVSNANISWRDESSDQQLSIQQLNLRIGAIVPGQPVDLALDFVVENQTPAIKANIQLRGTPHLSAGMDQLNISKLVLSVDATGELLNGKPLKLKLETGVALNLHSQHLKLNGLQLDANGLRLNGDLEASDLANKPAFSGALKLAEVNLREWLAAHEMPLPATADAAAFTRVALAMNLAGTAEKLDITKLVLMLDDSNLSGELKIGNLTSAMPAIGFNLNVDAIDLDRYLPPSADEPTTATADKAAATPVPAAQAATTQTPALNSQGQAEAELLPVALLRQLNINGLFRVGKLTVKKLLAEEVELKVKARGGHLKVEQQVKKFYQGNLQAAVTLDVRGKEPLLQITKQATNIQAELLLQDLTENGRLRGTGRFNANLKTRGNTEQAFRQHLNGDVGFRFEKGAVKGIDLAQTLRETWAKIKGKPVPPASDKPETDFSELAGTATITQGILLNEDLMAKSPFLRVDGKGQVDLVQEQLDYRLTTTIVKSMEGQGSSDMKDLMGVPVPVKISGSFAAPKIRPDMDELAKRLLSGKVEQKIEEKLKGKLPDEVKDKLRGLFR